MNFLLNVIQGFLLISFLSPCTGFCSGQDLPDLALIAVEKSHSEIISESQHTWQINVNSEIPIENESITIEVLNGTVKNPRLKSSSNIDFSSLKAIVDDVITTDMSDEEKALALWRFVMDNTYVGPWGTSGDAVEHLNVYGYGYCGTFAAVLEPLWWAAGLKARHVNIGNHAATEVYYDDDWHYIDAHLRRYFLEKSNTTIASLDDLNNIPELWDLKRQKQSASKKGEKEYYMTMHPQDHGRSPVYSNTFTMSKGDMMTLTWRKNGEWCLERGTEGGGKPAPEPAIYANGIFRFRRDFSNRVHDRDGIVSSKNVDWDDSAAVYLHPKKIREEAQVVYKIQVPYFTSSTSVSGKFQRRNPDDLVAIDISTDNGKHWLSLWEAIETGVVSTQLTTDKTQEVTTYRHWKYSYLLRIRMRAAKSVLDVGVSTIESSNNLFYNPKSLPKLKNGANTLIFRDEAGAPRSIKVTYEYLEDHPIRVSKESPIEGEKVIISAIVSNSGTKEAETVLVTFYLGDPQDGGTKIGSDLIKEIAPGKIGAAQIQWKATRNNPNKQEKTNGAAIYVLLDPENVIPELNESNNRYSKIIRVLNPSYVGIPSRDYISISRKSDNPNVLALTATIRNFIGFASYGFYVGDHAEAENIIVKFFDDEPKKGNQIGPDQIIERVRPLEFEKVSVDWNISKLNGQRKIYVQVFTPQNVVEALGPKEPETTIITLDLDKYKQCVAGSDRKVTGSN